MREFFEAIQDNKWTTFFIFLMLVAIGNSFNNKKQIKMAPKEKAEELVLKYLKIDNNTKEWFNSHIAKQCTLIAVNEIINDLEKWCELDNYWEEVKLEIIKL